MKREIMKHSFAMQDGEEERALEIDAASSAYEECPS